MMHPLRHALAGLLLICIQLNLSAVAWELTVEPDGTFVISHEQAPIIRSKYVLWNADWRWAHTEIHYDSGEIKGQNLDLGLRFSGQTKNLAPNRLEYTLTFEAERDVSDVIGGGLEFTIDLGSSALSADADAPELLPDRRGWKWELSDQQEIVLTFDAPLVATYFERGNRGRIRCIFLPKSWLAGTKELRLTVQLPESGAIVASASERYGPKRFDIWPADLFSPTESPVDLSYLNHTPAGRHGPIQVSGEFMEFADGTPARFWGGNVAAYALFVDNETIDLHAKRMAKLGYNLMRIHHHDSMRWVSPSVIDKTRSDSRHLDERGMDRIDYWIKALKANGIYVWLDLHVGRVFKEGDEIQEGFDEIARESRSEPGSVQGFSYYNPDVPTLMQEFNKNYLTHVNPYTQLAYKDDPAIVALLITNENDLTTRFGNWMLPDKNNPVHNAWFEADCRAFASRTGLPLDRVRQTWLPGPSKLYLSDREHRFNTAMLGHLRKLTQIPLATTNAWAHKATFALASLTDGDFIDVHTYGGAEELSKPLNHVPTFLSNVGTAQVSGKPITVSEWNVPYPIVDRFTAPLYVAGVASLQGWAAPMLYNYSQTNFELHGRPEKWSTYMDPGISSLLPAAALAFRLQHIASSKEQTVLSLTEEDCFYTDTSAKSSPAIRLLMECQRLRIDLPTDQVTLPWLIPSPIPKHAAVIQDPGSSPMQTWENQLQSETKELSHNWEEGTYRIDTARSQALMGWLGGTKVATSHLSLELDTPKATVAISSMDDAPLQSSRRILISCCARCEAKGGKLPFYSEPVAGVVAVKARSGLTLWKLSGNGHKPTRVPVQYEDGWYQFSPTEVGFSHWYLLADEKS